MQVGAVRFELGFVGHRTDQRVAESVLSRWGETDLINQLDAGQHIHDRINAQRGEQLRCEAQSDHRRGVERLLGIRFEAVDARKSQVVEMRFFGGLTLEETAEALQISRDTVTRDWNIAKLWLLRELRAGTNDVI